MADVLISLLIAEIQRIRINKELKEVEFNNKAMKKKEHKEDLSISMIIAIIIEKNSRDEGMDRI